MGIILCGALVALAILCFPDILPGQENNGTNGTEELRKVDEVIEVAPWNK